MKEKTSTFYSVEDLSISLLQALSSHYLRTSRIEWAEIYFALSLTKTLDSKNISARASRARAEGQKAVVLNHEAIELENFKVFDS